MAKKKKTPAKAKAKPKSKPLPLRAPLGDPGNGPIYPPLGKRSSTR